MTYINDNLEKPYDKIEISYDTCEHKMEMKINGKKIKGLTGIYFDWNEGEIPEIDISLLASIEGECID